MRAEMRRRCENDLVTSRRHRKANTISDLWDLGRSLLSVHERVSLRSAWERRRWREWRGKWGRRRRRRRGRRRRRRIAAWLASIAISRDRSALLMSRTSRIADGIWRFSATDLFESCLCPDHGDRMREPACSLSWNFASTFFSHFSFRYVKIDFFYLYTI